MTLNNEIWTIIGFNLNPLDVTNLRLSCKRFNKIFTGDYFKNNYKYQKLYDGLKKKLNPTKMYQGCVAYHCLELRDIVDNKFDNINYDIALGASIVNNCMECIEFLIKIKKVNNWDIGICTAVLTSNHELIDFFIDKFDNFDEEVNDFSLITSCIQAKDCQKLVNRFVRFINQYHASIYYLLSLKHNKPELLDIFTGINPRLYYSALYHVCGPLKKLYNSSIVEELFRNWFTKDNLDYSLFSFNIAFVEAINGDYKRLWPPLKDRMSRLYPITVYLFYSIFKENIESVNYLLDRAEQDYWTLDICKSIAEMTGNKTLIEKFMLEL